MTIIADDGIYVANHTLKFFLHALMPCFPVFPGVGFNPCVGEPWFWKMLWNFYCLINVLFRIKVLLACTGPHTATQPHSTTLGAEVVVGISFVRGASMSPAQCGTIDIDYNPSHLHSCPVVAGILQSNSVLRMFRNGTFYSPDGHSMH